jgi:hypothetical protein
VAIQRSEEVRIKALEAQIAALKARAARKLVKKDPALRHIHAAVKSIDKALSASGDHATRQALSEARNTLAACLALSNGTLVPQPRRSAAGVSEDVLLSHVRTHPGQRGEEIAKAMGTEAATVRPVMKRLIEAGRVRAQGRARAMSYSAA